MITNPQQFYESINNENTLIACRLATELIFFGAIGDWTSFDAREPNVYIPGDWGRIHNAEVDRDRNNWRKGLEGENFIHFGTGPKGDQFWGHLPGQTITSMQDWMNIVRGFRGNDRTPGKPVLERDVKYPSIGLDLE
jgi:hypothetical protein